MYFVRWRSVRRFATDAPTKEFVHGIHPCAAVLAWSRTGLPKDSLSSSKGREIKKVYVARSDAATEKGLSDILHELSQRGLRVIYTDRQHLSNMVHQPVVQGIAFEVSTIVPTRIEEPPPLESYNRSYSPLLVVLDELQDVHNVGAIARSALLFHADGLVTAVRGTAPLNGTVSKVSSGALEHLYGKGQLYITQSLPQFLSACREAGWRVIGAAAPPQRSQAKLNIDSRVDHAAERLQGASSTSVDTTVAAPVSRQVAYIPASELQRDAPTVLVLGSEGKGLRTNVKKECTTFAYIPMATGHSNSNGSGAVRGLGAVESLNVSAAAAILLHQLFPREVLR